MLVTCKSLLEHDVILGRVNVKVGFVDVHGRTVTVQSACRKHTLILPADRVVRISC